MRTTTALLGLFFTACTCGEPEAAPPDGGPGLDRTPGAIPEGWLMELTLGADAVAAIRARAPERLRSALPGRAADVLDAWVPVPVAIGDAIVPGTPVRCVHMLQGDDEVTACAARVGAIPDTLLRDPTGPRGSVWLAERSSESAVALAGDVIVAGRTTDAVAAALPYLAFDAMERPAAREEVRARIASGALGARLRVVLERAIEHRAEQALVAAAGLERLAQPEALVGLARDAALEAAAALPDLGEVELVLAPDDRALVLRADAEVRAGTSLASALEVAPAPPGLEHAPGDVVLAWTLGASRARDPSELVARAALLAGDRVDAAERAAIEAAIREWTDARGDGSRGAIALGARGPYLTLASECRRPLDRRAIAAALRGRWAHALGATLGCEEGDRSCPRLGGEACALVIGADDAVPPAVDPAVARALAAAPPRALARAVIVPARLGALSGGIAPEGGDPIVISATRDGSALRIELAAGPGALDALARVIGR